MDAYDTRKYEEFSEFPWISLVILTVNATLNTEYSLLLHPKLEYSVPSHVSNTGNSVTSYEYSYEIIDSYLFSQYGINIGI